jgi:hypothetical protein
MEREVRERFERIEAMLERSAARSEKSEAESKARFERIEARQEKWEARFEKSEARFEKRMRGFEKLAEIAFRRMAQMERWHREADERFNALIQGHLENKEGIRELRESTKETQAMLRQFLKSLGKGSNGH